MHGFLRNSQEFLLALERFILFTECTVRQSKVTVSAPQTRSVLQIFRYRNVTLIKRHSVQVIPQRVMRETEIVTRFALSRSIAQMSRHR